MEENRILEFVREFNAGLENSNEYNSLQYQNDGYQEGILLPNIYIWSDDEGSEFFKQKALSSLVRQLELIQNTANDLLEVEISKFFAGKKKDIEEKFSNVKLSYTRKTILTYQVEVEGNYNEDIMEDFIDVLGEDFKYIFNGLKIDVLYQN